MNILASYSWLKEYVKTSLSPEDFAREMSLKSMSVESIEYLSKRYEKILVGEVREVKVHPNADKLKIALTDIGTDAVEIVCGGVNLAAGQRVAVALPGAKVRWHGEGELIELGEAKIRGVASFGMICAPDEIGFEKYPAGEGEIWDLTDVTQAKAGTPLVEALDMDDVMFDIEVTTNRPDAMNIVGLAREAGAALEQPFEWEVPELPSGGTGIDLSVSVEEPALCPRYMAVAIDGIEVKPSPLWMQKRLLLAGFRPINNIVDITNYILHEYGQPLHAFDADKIAGGKIVVRKAKAGEKFLALDDVEYELANDQLVIADTEKPVAIAGVMGGKDSGTWGGTTRIVFEAAAFNATSVRKTARALNLYSQSQSMFEKGLSTESPAAALAHAVELALELAGGKVASTVVDTRASAYEPRVFPFRPERTRALIGVDISDETMVGMLERLGFDVKRSGDAYDVTVPYWRDNDVEAEVDFTEEIARLYGYHNMPAVLPSQAPPTAPEDAVLAWEDWLKCTLAASGYTECYGYSFVSADDLKKYGLDAANALKIHNELTSDHTHMRTSLMPSLLKDVELNQGTTPAGAMFELQNVYVPRAGDLPDERTNLVVSHFGSENVEADVLKIKGAIEYVCEQTGVHVEFCREDIDARWHPTRTVQVKMNGAPVGWLGQVAQEYQDAFGVNKPVVAANIDLQDILPKMKQVRSYQEIPAFPSVARDIAVLVDAFAEFGVLAETVRAQSALLETVDLTDVYRGAGIPEGKKSVTLSLTFRAGDKTLSSEEVDREMQAVEKGLKDTFDAVVR